MKKNVIRLNEGQLRRMLSEAVRRVVKEGLGDSNWFLNNEPHHDVSPWFEDDYNDEDERYNPDEEAKEVFDQLESICDIDASDAEVDVLDNETGLLLVHVSENGWQFWFRAQGKRVDETDLGCTIRPGEVIEYTSQSGDKGDWKVESRFGSHILIKNYFDYEV